MEKNTVQGTILRKGALALATAAALFFTACGGTGNGSASGSEGSGEAGYEFGASQEEINEVIADLEPVELVMQPGSPSPETVGGLSSVQFAEAVEELSNGQISLELVWGNSIAAFSEVEDALLDGRLDIAQQGPLYFPNEYPVWNEMAAFSHYAPSITSSGVVASSAATTAMMAELAWEDEALVEEITSQGLIPLQPMLPLGEWMTACSSPETALSDWEGRQIRIASAGQVELSQAIGATPVSLEFTEAYEALQRGTVDCVWGQASTSVQNGVPEVAPYMSYPTEGSFTGQSGISLLGGPSLNELPLAYQQILFDAGVSFVDGLIQTTMVASSQVLDEVQSQGGGYEPLDTETQEILFESQAEVAASIQESGNLGSDIIERAEASADKWEQVAIESGVEDGGDFEAINEWYDEDASYADFVTKLYEESYLPHRPN